MNERKPTSAYLDATAAQELREISGSHHGDASKTLRRLIHEAHEGRDNFLPSSGHTAYFLPEKPFFTLALPPEEIKKSVMQFPYGRWLERGLQSPDREDHARVLYLIGEEKSLPNLSSNDLDLNGFNDFLQEGGKFNVITRKASEILKGSLIDLAKKFPNALIALSESDGVESTSYAIVARESGAVDIKMTPDLFAGTSPFSPGFFLSTTADTYTTTVFDDAISKVLRSGREIPLSIEL